MRFLHAVVASLALSGLVFGTAGAQDLRQYGAQGVYARLCASCHGERGRGDGPVAEILVVPVPDLARLASRFGGTFPEDHVRRTIGSGTVDAHGPRHMPVWGVELWIIEGADRAAMERTLELIDMLVDFVRGIQEAP